jgi:hypothetical protein
MLDINALAAADVLVAGGPLPPVGVEAAAIHIAAIDENVPTHEANWLHSVDTPEG